ncbi:MAG TPA: hypothetical protein DEB39_12105 [Planctomycetaceae bacterium]|nr:hypothetical protein [Planctomycetaceae bacterium]
MSNCGPLPTRRRLRRPVVFYLDINIRNGNTKKYPVTAVTVCRKEKKRTGLSAAQGSPLVKGRPGLYNEL